MASAIATPAMANRALPAIWFCGLLELMLNCVTPRYGRSSGMLIRLLGGLLFRVPLPRYRTPTL